MKISIRGKIFLAFVIFIGLSALIWARSYYSQYILNQKIQIIERKYDLLNTILEARRYEKNYFLSFDKKNIVEALDYVRHAEDILRNILTRYSKYTLAKNLDQRITELVTYKDSLADLLKLQEEGHLVVPPNTVELIRKQGRILTSELEKIVTKESQFIRESDRKIKDDSSFGADTCFYPVCFNCPLFDF